MKNKQENQYDAPLSLGEMFRYLEGKLSPEATAAMDARLVASPEDAAAMEALSRQIDEEGADPSELLAAEADFLTQLDPSATQQAAPQTPVRPMPKSRGFKPWMAIAAAVLILAIPTVLLWPRAMGGEEAFQAYFEPYENVVTARAGGPVDGRIRQGLEAYDTFLYEEAAAKFGERLAEDSTDLYANLYGGISLLAMGDAQAALPHLGYVGNGSNALQQPGKWYLALAHLALNDRSLAEKHLDALASGKGKYPDLARKVLADIR